jgi:aminopeptidase N
MRTMRVVLVLSVLAGVVPAVDAQTPAASCASPSDPYDSGGRPDPDEAVYDVGFYDLAVRVNPADSTITGRVTMYATTVAPATRVAFDLDTLLAVESLLLVQDGAEANLAVERCGGRVRVVLPRTWQPGEPLVLRVAYGGRPRVAPRPPWDGGITWERTPSGAPWIATSNQTIGADVWWPVKDHVSDKPDSMAITVTVPEPLVVASNGRLLGSAVDADGWRTWEWFVSTPISTYNVALNIAPYRTIRERFVSVAGDEFLVAFYVLPEDEERGRALFPEILEHLRWYEQVLGPYPFRVDKYGVAQTPHLGMEHQSIIAYGANFSNASMTGGIDWGFDALHHHELAHEWWGNLLTNADWKDMWVHEGFGTYMQVLWLEDTQGMPRARAYLGNMRRMIGNQLPMAPTESQSAQEIYRGHDIYYKGAWVLHTLRWLIGDDAFFRALRHMVYPDAALAHSSDGRAVRFVASRDFEIIPASESGRDLAWFFDAYLRSAELPRLDASSKDGRVRLAWVSPSGEPFPMPVEVRIGEAATRLDMAGGTATVTLPAGATMQIDPDGWVLRALQEPSGGRR